MVTLPPDPVFIGSSTLISPAPPKIISRPVPVIFPDDAISKRLLSVSELILVSAPIVIVPKNLLFPWILLIAPPLLIPVPLIVIGSALNCIVFPELLKNSNAAPSSTTVPLPVAPRPYAFATLTIPASTLVVPE